jgi:putative ATPase
VQAEIQASGSLPVPLHLRNAPTELLRELGYGKGYRYPHDAPGHFVREQYLPDEIRDSEFYKPSDQGAERELAERQQSRWERKPGR